MKQILLFGAGKSATVLIDYLLEHAGPENWCLLVADASQELAESKTAGHPRATTAGLDIHEPEARRNLISRADLVISMMPPALHILIAEDCLFFGKHLLTASYADDALRSMHDKAKEKGILFLCEMGLDPGIDHMSALKLIHDIKSRGGHIQRFKSHCGGLVAPESDDNPWHYKISWNPRNVVMAGKAGALYREQGRDVQESYEQLFDASRRVDIQQEGIEQLSYYPNRNSLPYIELYGLEDTQTFIRTTLRYPDFMFGWKNLIELKLTDETPAYHTDGMSLLEFYKHHMQLYGFGKWLDQKLAERFAQTKLLLENLSRLMEWEAETAHTGQPIPDHLMLVDEKGALMDVDLDEVKNRAAAEMTRQIHEANLTLRQLFYLGLDDKETIINKGFCSAADVLQLALERKLALKPGDKDMIVMLHEIDYELDGASKSVRSCLLVKGDDHLRTAMAKTVGLPLGIAAKWILNGTIRATGVCLPVTPEIYDPVLQDLQLNGIRFTETES